MRLLYIYIYKGKRIRSIESSVPIDRKLQIVHKANFPKSSELQYPFFSATAPEDPRVQRRSACLKVATLVLQFNLLVLVSR